MNKYKCGGFLSVLVMLGCFLSGQAASAASYVVDDDSLPTAPDFLCTEYTDDSACLQAAIDAAAASADGEDLIDIREGDYWLPRQVVGRADIALSGINDGANEVNIHVALGNSNPGLYFTGSLALTHTALTADAATGATAITLASTAGVAAGDLVRLYNNVIWSEDDSAPNTGELYVVASVDGLNLNLTSPLIRDYTTAQMSKAFIHHPIEVDIDNLNIYGAGTAVEVRGITFEFCSNSSITNSYFRANGMAAIYLLTCYDVEIANNQIYDSNMVGYGYGVAPCNASSTINIHHNYIRNCRHGITSGTASSYGLNRDITIANNELHRDNGISVPIDAHPATINYTVTDNVIYAGYYDVDGNFVSSGELAFHDGTFSSTFIGNTVYDAVAVKQRGLVRGGTKIIKNNTISGTDAGIFTQIGGVFNTLDIEDNTLTTDFGTGTPGVNLYNDLYVENLIIRNNTIEHSEDGIYVNLIYGVDNPRESNITITGNTIRDLSKNGIIVYMNRTAAAALEISGNSITNVRNSALQVNVGAGTAASVKNVHDNNISIFGLQTGSYGIVLGGGSNYTNVYDNLISDSNGLINNHGFGETSGDYNHVHHNRILGIRNPSYLCSKVGANTVLENNGEIATDSEGAAFPINATYDLTINNRTGSTTAAYAPGATVTITADAPVFGKEFDEWSGYIACLADYEDATTTVTMPAMNTVLYPKYRSNGLNSHVLTVVNGTDTTGDGPYDPGEVATIVASAPAAGKVFDHWTVTYGGEDTVSVTNAAATTTTVVMPQGDVTLTATYADASATVYQLSVTGGSGTGAYTEGFEITISADAPATGLVFDRWTGYDSYVASKTAATTVVTMPPSAISLTATYKASTATLYQLTVSGGSGSGSYTAGSSVSVAAGAPAAGKVFDHWTGDTDYLSDISDATAVFTQPARAASLTAVYRDLYTPLYELAVTEGIGSGSYMSGVTIAVAAYPAAAGKVFDRWTGDTEYLGSATDSATTFTMPAEAASVIATYKDKCATPTFSLATGTYSGAQSVALSTTTAGATLHYTTDGTTPSASSAEYSAALSISSATTLKAIAVKTGCADSEVAIAVYGFNTTTSSGGGGGGGGSVARTTPEILIATVVSVEGNIVTLSFNVRDANLMMVSDNSAFAGGAWESYAATKVYTKKDGQGVIYIKFKSASGGTTAAKELSAAAGSAVVPVPTAPATGSSGSASGSSGTLIKTPDSFKVYVLIDNKKKWISTPEVFEQLGYQWTNITVLTDEQLDSYADYEDNLIRTIGDYKVYLVVNGVRRHIPNPNIFLGYGFRWEDVKDVPAETVNKYQPAFLLKQSGLDGIWYVTNGVRKLIPTMDIFASYGDKLEDVQVVSQAELESYPVTNLIRLGGANDVYLIKNNLKYRVPNPTVFAKYRFDWNRIVNVNRAEFDYYQSGGELK